MSFDANGFYSCQKYTIVLLLPRPQTPPACLAAAADTVADGRQNPASASDIAQSALVTFGPPPASIKNKKTLNYHQLLS